MSAVCALDQGVLHGDAPATCTERGGRTFSAVVSKLSVGIDGFSCDVYTIRDQSERASRGIEKKFEDAILELSRSPADTDFSSAASRIVKVAAEVIDVDRVSLWLIKDSGKLLECISLYEKSKESHSAGTRLRFDQYPNYFRALDQGRSIAAVDAAQDPRTAEFAKGYLDVLEISSMLDSVIRVAGKVVGVVCHESVGAPRVWNEDEIIFSGEVADLAGMAFLAEKNRTAATIRRKLEAELREAQKLEAIGRLAGGVAHDFNNLLSVILGHTDFALQHELAPDLRLWFAEIKAAGKKAADLTSQLLSIGRKQVLCAEPIDINYLIQEQVELIAGSFPANVRLEFDERSPSAIAVADSRLVERAILNLCMNSRDALPDGGRIAISTRVESVRDNGAGWVVIQVSDDGVGMSEHVRERVFEPFFTTKEESGGTGLGLPTVYGIAHQHGGFIEVTSLPGRGTSIEIFLPRAEPDDVPGPAKQMNVAREPRTLPRGSGRILVAEDSASIRRFLVRLLEHAGYEVTFAEDGEQAIELFDAHSSEWDLVMLDVILPKLTGTEAFQQIRELSPEVPVLFTTGYDRESLGTQTQNQENVYLLPKPWDSKSLLEVIGRAIAKK